MSTVRISVAPTHALERRRRLFAGLERAHPVRFVPAGAGADAAILIGGGGAEGESVPLLVLGEREGSGNGRIELGSGSDVPRSFRSCAFSDTRSSDLDPVPAGDDDTVLATVDGRAVWTHSPAGTGIWRAAAAPDELDEGEALRDRLAPGRFVALLPLVDFVRRLAAPFDWTQPKLRASFVVDDPNLFRARYGYIDYARLAKTARAHEFHAAMALIPLDAWYASAAASRIFRDESEHLSLLVHGNDHVSKELGRERAPADFDAMFTQALRRISRFERRSGVGVARVMAAPHGAVCQGAREGLDRAGFDAICSSNAYAWVGDDVLRGWTAGAFASGCVGALPRLPWTRPLDDVPFRSYLGQPIVLYGHHEDLAQGPETLAAIAETVSRSGEVQWGSLETMGRASVETRLDGATLFVRPASRNVDVHVPEGIEAVVVHLHPSVSPDEVASVVCTNRGVETAHAVGAGPTIDLGPLGAGTQRLRLVSRAEIDLDTVRRPRRSAWPLVRRALTYTRDQAMPLARRRATV